MTTAMWNQLFYEINFFFNNFYVQIQSANKSLTDINKNVKKTCANEN